MSDQSNIRELITPEGVDLRLRIGDAGERAGALLIDLVIMVVTLAVVLILAFVTFASSYVAKSKIGAEASGAVGLVSLFLIRFFYFTLFEMGRRAATPGKLILGLRVAARNGGRLTADMVIARNLMRELEVFMPLSVALSGGDEVDSVLKLIALVWSGVFVLFPLFNRDRLRVGDMVAGTWVVKVVKPRLLPDIARDADAPALGFDFTQAQLDAYGVYELQVLEDVLRKRDRKTLASVADRIRMKIGWTRRDNENDTDFLSAYYTALRARLEGRLLFGKRKKDKFDVS